MQDRSPPRTAREIANHATALVVGLIGVVAAAFLVIGHAIEQAWPAPPPAVLPDGSGIYLVHGTRWKGMAPVWTREKSGESVLSMQLWRDPPFDAPYRPLVNAQMEHAFCGAVMSRLPYDGDRVPARNEVQMLVLELVVYNRTVSSRLNLPIRSGACR